jgi:hypothetical protein
MLKSAKMAGKIGQKWASESFVFQAKRMVIRGEF